MQSSILKGCAAQLDPEISKLRYERYAQGPFEQRYTQKVALRAFADEALANGGAKCTPKRKYSLGFGVADSHAKGFQDLKEDRNAAEELLKFAERLERACSMVVVREDREHLVELSGTDGAFKTTADGV